MYLKIVFWLILNICFGSGYGYGRLFSFLGSIGQDGVDRIHQNDNHLNGTNVDGNKEIVLIDSKIKNDIFYVEEDKEVDIVFENVHVKRAECLNNNGAIIQSNKENLKATRGNIINTLSVSNIKRNMLAPSTMYCKVYQADGGKLEYNFQLQSSKQQKVKIKVGYSTLDFRSNNTSIYKYNDGELIDWSCSKNVNGPKSIDLKYYDANGDLMVESDQISGEVGRFRQVMTAQHNNSYVNCTYNYCTDQCDPPYQTIFMIKEQKGSIDECNFLTIKINDIKIKCLSWNTGTIYRYTYMYKYLYGENLTITCETVKEFGSIRKADTSKDIQNNPTVLNKNTTYKFFINTTYLEKNSSISYYYKNPQEPHIKIFTLYLNRDNDVDPFVIGLPARNILYQYTKSEKNWTIFYQYTPNESLNLKCNTNLQNRTITWKNESTGEEITTYNKNNAGYLHLNVLKNSSIFCESPLNNVNYTTTIKFIQNSVELSNDNPILIYIVITIFVIIVIIAMTFMSYRYMKNYVKKDRFAIFHNNITASSDFRNQVEGNEYAYIRNSFSSEYGVSVANTLYRSSGPSNNYKVSNLYTENHYCEIDENIIGNRDQTGPGRLYENKEIRNDASVNDNYTNLRHKDNDNDNINYSNDKLENYKKYANLQPENNYINKETGHYAN